MKKMGLFDMMDQGIAGELGVDVETYIKVIDHKCTDDEANFIILAVLGDDEDELVKAKELFNSYLDKL
jgi:hypothetical protein